MLPQCHIWEDFYPLGHCPLDVLSYQREELKEWDTVSLETRFKMRERHWKCQQSSNEGYGTHQSVVLCAMPPGGKIHREAGHSTVYMRPLKQSCPQREWANLGDSSQSSSHSFSPGNTEVGPPTAGGRGSG